MSSPASATRWASSVDFRRGSPAAAVEFGTNVLYRLIERYGA